LRPARNFDLDGMATTPDHAPAISRHPRTGDNKRERYEAEMVALVKVED
jgi:hypothetical protein